MKRQLFALIKRTVDLEYEGTPPKLKLDDPLKWDGKKVAKFNTWLPQLLRYMCLTGLAGNVRKMHCIQFLGTCLEGDALNWFNSVIDPVYINNNHPNCKWKFKNVIWKLYSHFMHDTVLNNVATDFWHVTYNHHAGVSGLYFDLMKHASCMLRPPSKQTIIDQMFNQIPSDMRNYLIDCKDVVPEFVSLSRFLRYCREYENKEKTKQQYNG